jgi:hypothetical protein
MNGRKSTLYDVLGLTRDAKQSDIIRVYRRLSAEMQREAAAPNPRRAALIHEAYEVLSDPARREAYDKSLRSVKFTGVRGTTPGNGKWVALGVLAVIALGAGYYFGFVRTADKPAHVAAMSLPELQAAASVSVGRVNRVEMSGARATLAAAVAVEEGVMMAPCEGIDPAAQIVVRIPPRDIPAQLKHADAAAGLCKLAVSGGGSWPLRMTSAVPRAGDKVYAANLNALGEVVVTAGEVRKIGRGPRGEVIESTARAGVPVDGTPLLDQQGRVVAIAMGGQHTVLPRAWIVVDVPMAKRPPPAREEAAPPPAAAPEASPEAEKVSPERRERLEKAFRPPPTVPGDL